MGLWLAVAVILVSATLLFLLACVSPKGDGLLSNARRLIFSRLPEGLERLTAKVLGPGFYPKLRYYLTYPFFYPTPLFQITYLGIAFFGFYVYWVHGFSRLPNEYFSSYHIYTGSIAFAITIAVFLLANMTPPGSVTASNLPYYLKVYRCDGLLFKEMDCTACKRKRPARSKHCRICNICVPRFDHHCIWINGCVGEGNYKYFLAFLLTTTLICVYAEIVAISILVSEIKREGLLTGVYYTTKGDKIDASYSVAASYLLQRQPSFIFILLLCVMMSLALGGFFLHHCWLASRNVTSYERAKRLDMTYALEIDLANHPDKKSSIDKQLQDVDRNPFDKGFLSNWSEVMQ